MGFPKVFVTTLIIIGFLFVVAATKAEDGNAVGGSVRSAASNTPLADVSVSVVQDSHISDNSRQDDGVYTLKVSLALKQFDILYHKVGYLDSYDFNVQNNLGQQKRPLVRMTPESAIGTLQKETLQGIVEASAKAVEQGKSLKMDILIDSGTQNLQTVYKHMDPSNQGQQAIQIEIRDILGSQGIA